MAFNIPLPDGLPSSARRVDVNTYVLPERGVTGRGQRMSLVSSLLRAIVRANGEVLVLHVGDRPYVVSPTGQVEVAARALSVSAVDGIVSQLLPTESRAALEEHGVAQHELRPSDEFPGERFTVVAARGGADVWAEIRRQLVSGEDVGTVVGRPAHGETIPPVIEGVTTVERAVPSVAGADVRAESRSTATPRAPAFMPIRQPQSTRNASSAPLPEAKSLPARESAERLAPSAVVLQLPRHSIRLELPPPLGEQPLAGLDQLLRLGAAHGASILYLSSGSRPSIRIDGSIRTLDAAPVFDANEVESLLLTLMPGRDAEALRTGLATEWISSLEGVGRVRCMTFRDDRGPGGVFHLIPAGPVTAVQLGLSPEIRALALEREGLVLVAGSRSTGKRTLVASLVDLVNRSRGDRVITIEREVTVLHEPMTGLVSQREVRGGGPDVLDAVRAALREDPDVLVIEELQTMAVIESALEAAARHLVIGSLAAPTTSAAIDRVVDLYPPGERQRVQLLLAQRLRGVVVQVLLPKIGGGRIAARELLLRTAGVAGLLVEGKTSQLPLAIEGGRQHGMAPLNDAIVGFVQAGAVDVREAYRWSADRAGFVALLKRGGLDTSFAEGLD